MKSAVLKNTFNGKILSLAPLQLTASSSDLAAALQLSMRAVQHENVDVRIHALTSLRDMMHSQQVRKHTRRRKHQSWSMFESCTILVLQEWLLRQVCASEAVEPVISSLVSVLLRGCQDSSPEARLLCGECLGELGAVDPGRLDLSRTDNNGDRNTFVVSRTSAQLLVMHVRLFYLRFVVQFV